MNMKLLLYRVHVHRYIHILYLISNLKCGTKVAKDKLVSSSYKYDYKKTNKTRNYNIIIFKLLKSVILTIL